MGSIECPSIVSYTYNWLSKRRLRHRRCRQTAIQTCPRQHQRPAYRPCIQLVRQEGTPGLRSLRSRSQRQSGMLTATLYKPEQIHIQNHTLKY